MNHICWKAKRKNGTFVIIPIVDMASTHIRNAIKFLESNRSIKTKFQQAQLHYMKAELLRRKEVVVAPPATEGGDDLSW